LHSWRGGIAVGWSRYRHGHEQQVAANSPKSQGDGQQISVNGFVLQGRGQLVSRRGSIFAIDLTQQAAAAAATATTRAGNSLFPAQSATVAALVGNNAMVYEDRGDGIGGGVWSLASFTNTVSNPFAFDNAAWTVQAGIAVTPNTGASPDGTVTADRIDDTSGASHGAVYQLLAGAAVDSVWVRDFAADPPTAPGMLSGLATAVTGVSFGSGTLWRRVSVAGNGIVALFPAGVQPGPVVIDPATGSIEAWGAQCVVGALDPPLCDGTSGNAGVAVSGVSSMSADGTVHVVGKFLPSWPIGTSTPTGYIFSATIGGALFALRYDSGTDSYTVTARGVDVLTVGTPSFAQGNTAAATRAGIECGYELLFHPGGGNVALRILSNGCWSTYSTAVAAGPALGATTAVYLGSNLGASGFMSMRHTALTAYPKTQSALSNVEGIVLGDSVTSSYIGYGASPSFIYTFAESRSRAGIYCAAIPGDTIQGQQAHFDAYIANYSPAWVGLAAGLNNLNPATPTADIIAAIQASVNDVRSKIPTRSKILIATLTPCRQRLITVFGGVGGPIAYQQWLDINAAISGAGPTPITGVDARVTSQTATLNDGAGNLAAPYNSGDDIHTNDVGRGVQGGAWRVSLVSLGILP
jgi:hypothetical protein